MPSSFTAVSSSTYPEALPGVRASAGRREDASNRKQQCGFFHAAAGTSPPALSLALPETSYEAFWQRFFVRLWLALLRPLVLDDTTFSGLAQLAKKNVQFFADLWFYGREVLNYIYFDVQAPEEAGHGDEDNPGLLPPCPPQPPYAALRQFWETCLIANRDPRAPDVPVGETHQEPPPTALSGGSLLNPALMSPSLLLSEAADDAGEGRKQTQLNVQDPAHVVSEALYCEFLFYMRTLFTPHPSTVAASRKAAATARQQDEVASSCTGAVHPHPPTPAFKMEPVVNVILSVLVFPGFAHYLLYSVLAEQTRFLDHADSLVKGVQQILQDVYARGSGTESDDTGVGDEGAALSVAPFRAASGAGASASAFTFSSPLATRSGGGILFLVLHTLFHFLNAPTVHAKVGPSNPPSRNASGDGVPAPTPSCAPVDVELPMPAPSSTSLLSGERTRTRAGNAPPMGSPPTSAPPQSAPVEISLVASSASAQTAGSSSDTEVVLRQDRLDLMEEKLGIGLVSPSRRILIPSVEQQEIEKAAQLPPETSTSVLAGRGATLSNGAAAPLTLSSPRLPAPHHLQPQPPPPPPPPPPRQVEVHGGSSDTAEQRLQNLWRYILLSTFPREFSLPSASSSSSESETESSERPSARKDTALDLFLKALRDTLPTGNFPPPELLERRRSEQGASTTLSASTRREEVEELTIASPLWLQKRFTDRYVFSKGSFDEEVEIESEISSSHIALATNRKQQRLADFIRVVRRVLEAIFFHKPASVAAKRKAPGESETARSKPKTQGATSVRNQGHQGVYSAADQHGAACPATGSRSSTKSSSASSSTSMTTSNSKTNADMKAGAPRTGSTSDGGRDLDPKRRILGQNTRLSQALFPMYEEIGALLEANRISGGLWTISGGCNVNVEKAEPLPSTTAPSSTSTAGGSSSSKSKIAELRPGDRVRFLKWTANAEGFLDDLKIMRTRLAQSGTVGNSGASTPIETSNMSTTTAGSSSAGVTPVSAFPEGSAAPPVAFNSGVVRPKPPSPVTTAVVTAGPTLAANGAIVGSTANQAQTSSPATRPFRRENLESVLGCIPCARIVCVDQGVVGWIRVADFIASAGSSTSGGQQVTTAASQHSQQQTQSSKVRLQLQVRDEHLFEHAVFSSAPSTAMGVPTMIRRARMFMEESTLLRILRTYLEEMVVDDISGEAEGIAYELSQLTFPSLNTTKSFCHLRSVADFNPNLAQGGAGGYVGSNANVSANGSSAATTSASSSSAQASSLPRSNSSADTRAAVLSTCAGGATSGSAAPSASRNNGEDDKWSESRISGAASAGDQHVTTKYFSVTVKNLGLVIHHRWKTSGTLFRLQGENIVDVKDSKGEFVFAVTVTKPGQNKNPAPAVQQLVERTPTLSVKIVSAHIELNELELAIANSPEDNESQSMATRAWTSLLFGTLRRVLVRALQGANMREKLQSLLINLLQEKAIKPLENCFAFQRLVPPELCGEFVEFLAANIPTSGVQL